MDRKKLARVHRVRTLQLDLARAGEVRAQEAHASERALSARIAQLAQAIAPAHDAGAGFSLAAAAHYRERLHRSAESAANRVLTAEREAARAAEATLAAKRDQSAIEKLVERQRIDAVVRELRAAQDAPPVRKVRHGPC